MRKYLWLVIVFLTGSTFFITGCDETEQIMTTVLTELGTSVEKDTDPPKVTGGTISDGETVDSEVVNNDGRIEITFSEKVTGNIALQTEDGDDVGWIGKVEGIHGTLELVAGKGLGHAQHYVIKGKVLDSVGNQTTISIYFITAAYIPPLLIKTSLTTGDLTKGKVI